MPNTIWIITGKQGSGKTTLGVRICSAFSKSWNIVQESDLRSNFWGHWYREDNAILVEGLDLDRPESHEIFKKLVAHDSLKIDRQYKPQQERCRPEIVFTFEKLPKDLRIRKNMIIVEIK